MTLPSFVMPLTNWPTMPANTLDREERIQYKVGYRHYMDHKQAHQKLLARLDEVVSDIEAMKSTAELSKKSASIVQLLRDWLLDHVLKEDMKMKPELEISPPNLL